MHSDNCNCDRCGFEGCRPSPLLPMTPALVTPQLQLPPPPLALTPAQSAATTHRAVASSGPCRDLVVPPNPYGVSRKGTNQNAPTCPPILPTIFMHLMLDVGPCGPSMPPLHRRPQPERLRGVGQVTRKHRNDPIPPDRSRGSSAHPMAPMFIHPGRSGTQSSCVGVCVGTPNEHTGLPQDAMEQARPYGLGGVWGCGLEGGVTSHTPSDTGSSDTSLLRSESGSTVEQAGLWVPVLAAAVAGVSRTHNGAPSSEWVCRQGTGAPPPLVLRHRVGEVLTRRG